MAVAAGSCYGRTRSPPPRLGGSTVKYGIVAALWLAAVLPASAQAPGQPIIISGPCDPRSGVTIGDDEASKFACDTAIVMRSDSGTVLIQFTDKRGDDGRILGFAGTIEGKQGFGADPVQIFGVQRLYLGGGVTPVPVSRGSCIMNWSGLQRTGGRLTSVVCSAGGRAEGSEIKAIVMLKSSPP